MKKLLLTISLFLVIGIAAQAQKVTNRTISEICNCVKKIDSKLSENDRTDMAIVCMAASVEKNAEALKKEYNIKTNDEQAAAQEIGTKLGVQLITGCPEILPYLLNYAKRQQEGEPEDAGK